MPELRYLHRDTLGNVVGHYANPQPYATEPVPEDHPEILKWHDRVEKDRAEYMRRKAAMSPEALLARIEAIEKRLGI